MRRLPSVFLLVLSATIAPAAFAAEHVILLHGLARTNASMQPMAAALTAAGYTVHNIDYPSRTANIAELADTAIAPALAASHAQGAEKIHFVTHSLGGILVRSYFSRHPIDPALGRVVMLGPPNQGSEVVDCLGSWWLFQKINGPAGQELGTAATATPNLLGPPTFPVGIIAGNQSINWINSLMIAGPDDGKVSVAHTQLTGQTAHIVLPVTHPFMMKDRAVIDQTICFLRGGAFQ